MDSRRSRTMAAVVFVLSCTFFFSCPLAHSQPTGTTDILTAFNASPVPFTENTGRLPGNVRYYARTLGAGFFVTDDGRIASSLSRYTDGQGVQAWTVRESFPGATSFLGGGEGTTAVRVNDLPGNLSAGVTFDRLALGRIGTGIDLELRAYGDGLEKVFLVQPQARAGALSVGVEGAQELRVNAQGELEAVTGLGVMTFAKPVAYQQANGTTTSVDVAYEVRGDGYGFTLGPYDASKELVIVPRLRAAFADTDALSATAVDDNGNAYIAGETISPVLAATPGLVTTGATDAFIAKLDNNGLVSLTILGGSGTDGANAVTVDGQGSVYIAGGTASPDFPVTPGVFSTKYRGATDAFVAKLDSDLTTLIASTFLSGSRTDEAYAVATDGKGNTYVGGGTTSADFPVTRNAYTTTYQSGEDGFLSKLDGDLGNLLASSLLGGTGQNRITGITIDENGNVSVQGYTGSKAFPTPFGGSYVSPSGYLTPFTATFDPNLGSYQSFVPGSPVSTTPPLSPAKQAATPDSASKEKKGQTPTTSVEAGGPGWSSVKAVPITSKEAEAYYAKRHAELSALRASAGGGMILMAASSSSPEIDELARALRDDPKLIYDYVHNHIDYVPYFGSLKGALLTYLDGSGNDFDQASLMIALLGRAAVHSSQTITAEYMYGTMTIPGSDLANWLGVDQSQAQQAVGAVIRNGGGTIVGNVQSDGTATFYRAWVKANISGTDYVFDPAFKSYTYTSRIDIGTAMTYSESAFMSSTNGATQNATVTADYAQNINETNIRSSLATYASNLVSAIRGQHPNDDVKQIIGGRSINQTTMTSYQTSLPFSNSLCDQQVCSTVPPWSDVPDVYVARLRIWHAGLDCTLNIHDLSGKRLTVTYDSNDSYKPKLKLDGSIATTFCMNSGDSATGTATTPGQTYDLFISIDHPYPGSYCDQSLALPSPHPYRVKSGSTYAVIYNFGGISESLLPKRQQLLDTYRAQIQPDPEALVGETLNIMGQTWLKELAMTNRLLSTLAGTVGVIHHNVGLMAQETNYYGQQQAYYIDAKLALGSITSKDNTATNEQAHFKTFSLVGSAFEHGILAQLMGSTGASTMSLFQVANAAGEKIFNVTSSNYASIQSQLQNYSSGDLTNFYNLVNDQNYPNTTLILPESGALTINQWTGEGYISKYFSTNDSSMGMIISHSYGGFNTVPGPVSPDDVAWVNDANTWAVSQAPSSGQGAASTARDPVDMASGAFLHDRTDLSLGGDAPLGLAFARSYNSSRNLANRTLGNGWTHNYDVYLSLTSHGEPGLGRRQPVDAAGMIAALYTCLDLLKNQDDIQTWVAASLTAKWAVDQVIDNAVTMHLGHKVMEYIKLADGTYAPPPGVTTQLSANTSQGATTFSLQERLGGRIDFAPINTTTTKTTSVAQIVDVDNNTMTFTYNGSGDLTQAQDAFGRTLTLSYSGGRISGVADSASPSRSVSYGYDTTNNNLTSYTDAEGKVWQYGYLDATSHRVTSLSNPVSVTTATNTYDTLGRVMTQTVPRQTGTATYNFYFSGFRNQEEDPDNHTITYSYDEKGREFAREDALGNKVTKAFDGQDHVVSVVDPRPGPYTTSYAYDGNQNLTTITDPLSHLTTNTYESSFPYRLTETKDPLYTTGNDPFHKTHFAYLNATGHITGVSVYPSSGVTITTGATYYTDGLKETATDGRGAVSTFTYDSYGNPRTMLTGSHLPVTYTYDTIGRMTVLKNQLDWTTSFTYDKRNLLTGTTDSLGNSSSFVYYDNGNLHTKTDRKNHTTTYAYTPTDKIDTITYPDTSTVEFTYNQLDRPTSMVDAIGTTSYTYDATGRIATLTDPHGFVITYAYDEAGNVTDLTLSHPTSPTLSSRNVHYTYDALNRLETVRIDWLGGQPTATYSYDVAGRLTGLSHFNTTTASYGYDNANRLTSLENRKSDSTAIATYSFTLDENGNRTGVTQTEPYTNLPSMTATSYTYNLQKNRLLSNGSSFTYDDEGQLNTGYGNSYTFDYEHRLTGIGSTYTYSYDGAGRRLQAVRSGTTTRYIYDAAGNLLAEADGSNNITRYYVHGLGLLAMVTPADALYCYHFNATGSTMAMTDASQAFVNQYRYDPSGNILNQSETVTQPFKYVGQLGVMAEPSGSNGLYYMRARYYDPQVGRFISEDPIGFDGGDVNLYAYVRNNPVMGVDPGGLCDSCGGLSLSEANRHWREGGGEPLVIDINTLDLSNVSKLPPSGQVDFAGRNFSSVNDALVYGTVTLKPGPNNTVTGGFDYYNFDIKKPWSQNFVRNVETIAGRIYAGSGTPYPIKFTGTAPLGRNDSFQVPSSWSGGW